MDGMIYNYAFTSHSNLRWGTSGEKKGGGVGGGGGAHTECATSACRVIFGGYRVMPPLRQHIGKDSRSLQLSGKAISGKYRKKTRVRSQHTPKNNTWSKGKEDLYVHFAI